MENEKLVERLRHASVTASNDDYSKPGTPECERHVARLAVINEAAAALTAAAARIKALSEALELLVCDCDHRCNVQPSWPAMSKGCAHARARVVLGPRQALSTLGGNADDR